MSYKNNYEMAIKRTLAIINLLSMREKSLREEYEWYMNFTKNKPQVNYIKRHEHEAMFLCIDTYSLHEGISKKKSLLRRYIKNYGESIIKIKKVSEPNIIIVSSDSKENDQPLKNKVMKDMTEDRENTRQQVGIKSYQHQDIENWINENFNEDTNALLKKIDNFRSDFAHRFDSINKIEQHCYSNCVNIIKILDTIKEVLKHYQCYLNKILVYTTGQQFGDKVAFYYDSIARLKYQVENE